MLQHFLLFDSECVARKVQSNISSKSNQRFCVDYRPLNEPNKQVKFYPLPRKKGNTFTRKVAVRNK